MDITYKYLCVCSQPGRLVQIDPLGAFNPKWDCEQVPQRGSSILSIAYGGTLIRN